MTYDELVEKINPKETITIDDAVSWHYALLTVIKLHQPAISTSFRNNDCICMLPNKKCATILALETVFRESKSQA